MATISKRWASSPTSTFSRPTWSATCAAWCAIIRNDLSSNPLSTPVIAFQHNYFREGYFKGTVSVHRGRHEWKSASNPMHPCCTSASTATSPTSTTSIRDTPPTFSFIGSRPDLEQSAFVQDQIRLGKWTVSAGLRWDHYQLLVNENAVSPRLASRDTFPAWSWCCTLPTTASFRLRSPKPADFELTADCFPERSSSAPAGEAFARQLL